MPMVSIIVPVYKAEPYLHRCVDSILSQTFCDFELILVDDGSPDHSGAICDQYAAKDSRIRVIHQENGGPAVARNTGIDWAFANSDSQWLMFVDSDDWIHPEMLRYLWEAAQKFRVSIAACTYQQTMGKVVDISDEQLKPALWTMEDFYSKRNVDAVIPVCKLYAKCSFENLRYPAGKFAEDEYLSYQVLFQFSHIAVLPAPLYAYYVNPEGLTKGTWSPKKLEAWGALEEQIRFFHKTGRTELEKRQILLYIGNIKSQRKQIRRAGGRRKFPEEFKLTKTHKQEVFRDLRKAGYTDVIHMYWKNKVVDVLELPFVWKAELEEWWKLRK